MCIYSIYNNFGLETVENCIDDVDKVLVSESDLSTRRNSFLLLFHLDQDRALSFL
jgi:coatomer subunit beta